MFRNDKVITEGDANILFFFLTASHFLIMKLNIQDFV